jgi:hypothetical protein
VELVEDDRGHARQVRRVLDHPREDALRHDLDPRLGRDLRLPPDAVADGPPAGLAQGLCHALGRRAGGEAARLQQQDAPLSPGLQQREGHARRLARAGRGLKDGASLPAERGDQLGQDILDRQGGSRVGHRP